MATAATRATLDRGLRFLRLRRIRNAATLGLVLLGPVLALLTFFVLGPLDQGASTLTLRLVLLADLVYIIVVATLVLGTIARMITARRAKSAGSRLHLRLTGVFALIALIPTVTVAVFAGLTVNVGLEGWFSERVRGVVGASLDAAEAYREDQRADLSTDARALARYIADARELDFFVDDGELRQLLTQGQGLVQRGLKEGYVLDGTGAIRARGERSYLFDFERPEADDLTQAGQGDVVVIEDVDQAEYRALMAMPGFADRYLYISRAVDGRILTLLDDAAASARLYNQLESDRGRLVFEFGLLYLGFAVILILAAIWLGMWFAERLSRPVGRLTAAAQRVGSGDLDVQVIEEKGDDEIAMLGRIFNQMTRQLKAQRGTLLDTNRRVERRRRLFDSVLSSVSAGVVGLDEDGRVEFANRAAERILSDAAVEHGSPRIGEAIPEFGPLFDRLTATRDEAAQDEVRLTRAGRLENLLVRMATRRGDAGTLEGYVVAFDDVTDLVSAQRMAAWGDVARRIAHEIKNPLTPIQLSAERIQRKFGAAAGEQKDSLDQLTGVIIRQTGDLRRIVDEFSKFARMPEPDRRRHDLSKIVRDAVLLQDTAQDDIAVTADLPDGAVESQVDATMISQAMTNLVKNACEAIETLRENGAPDGHQGRVRVQMHLHDDRVEITIDDNGVGLPEDRARLFEPYVTTRASGTGLGLSIVRKIIEEHGGTLRLIDADPLDETGQRGARAEIRLPLLVDTEQARERQAWATS